MAKRILVIDDDTAIVQLIKLNLKMDGFEVATAYDGTEGLREAAAHPPDLIILDVMMPGLGGREVLERLKADPITREIPVLMLTALGGAGDITQSLVGGAEWHLTKPFELHELTEMARRLTSMPDAEDDNPA